MNVRPSGLKKSMFRLVIAALLSVPALAQDDQSPPATDPPVAQSADSPPIDATAIQTRIDELQQLDQEDEAVAGELELLQGTLTAAAQVDADTAAIADFREQARVAPDVAQQIQDELAIPLEDAIEPVPQDLSLDELTSRLTTLQSRLDANRKLDTDIENELNTRAARLAAIPDLIAQTTQSLTQLNDAIGSTVDPSDASPLAAAQRQNLATRTLALETKLTRLNEESSSYAARVEVIRLRRERAQRRVEIAERTLQATQTIVDEKRVEEADRTRLEAQRAADAAANAHPVVRTITEATAELATRNQQVASLSPVAADRQNRVSALIAQWQNEFDTIRKQEESIGLNEVLGLRLRSLQLQLEDRADLRSRLATLQEDIRTAQVALFDLDRATVVDLTAEAERLLDASTDPPSDDDRSMILSEVRAALQDQSDLRHTLATAYDENLLTLTNLYQSTLTLATLTGEFDDYINTHVLWIQSSASVNLDDLRDAGAALAYLVSPANWALVAQAFAQDARQGWPLYVILFLGLTAWITLLKKVRQELRESSDDVSRVLRDRYGLTSLALLYTIILAAGLPVLLWTLSWRLGAIATSDDFVLATAGALARTSTLLLIVEFLRQLSQPHGLAEAHFRWKSSDTTLMRRQLRWFVPIIIPLGFVTLLTNALTIDAHRDSLGRLSFVACMPVVALFAYRVMHPASGLPASFIAQHRDGWLDRFSRFWHWLITLVPVSLGIAATLGWVYTAMELHHRLINTISLLIILSVAYNVLMRWLLVAQRRLAVDQARKKRAAMLAAAEAKAAEQATAGTSEPEVAPADPPPELEDLKIDVAALSQQTRRVIRMVFAVFAWMVVLAVWRDILPALQVFRNVDIPGLMTTTFVDGVETPAAVTLADLLLGVLILVVMVVLNRNLTGLLEVLFLQRLPISAGARYAIVTLARYVVIIIGIAAAFDQIGIGWAQVQWLAAAITVGLGFGLQEIFANFVSGIIILFERPIRVGDTVTVGDINGTVSRIQMRATTVTDWDRKELIIPNKEFVTGQIINWSLSDALVRTRLPVGVAYGCDTDLARKLMIECATKNERVLDEPAPQAVFWGFGDSSLDFELRVFVPNIDHFVPVRHELNDAIDRAFRQHNIEIPFPQRDLHVRSVEPTIEFLGGKRVVDLEGNDPPSASPTDPGGS